jgi:hypothetical protein
MSGLLGCLQQEDTINQPIVADLLWFQCGSGSGDPAFKVNVDPDPGPVLRPTKSLKKKVTADKKENFFNNNCNLLILQPPYRTSKLQEKHFVLKKRI